MTYKKPKTHKDKRGVLEAESRNEIVCRMGQKYKILSCLCEGKKKKTKPIEDRKWSRQDTEKLIRDKRRAEYFKINSKK